VSWTGFPNTNGFLGIALERASIPLFGGELLIDPATLLDTWPILFDGVGSGGLSLGLPPTGLAGLRLDLQTIAWNAGFAFLSNGVELVICP
jgi:hypothetical protein